MTVVLVVLFAVALGILGYEVFRMRAIVKVMEDIYMFISNDGATVILSANKENIEDIRRKLEGSENDVH